MSVVLGALGLWALTGIIAVLWTKAPVRLLGVTSQMALPLDVSWDFGRRPDGKRYGSVYVTLLMWSIVIDWKDYRD